MAKTFSAVSGATRIPRDPFVVERAFREKLSSTDVLTGGIVTHFIRPQISKVYAFAGFDFVYLETEHTNFSGPALADFVLSCRDNGLPVIAKTPQLERAAAAYLLDAGVMGIQLPRTESRQNLLELIDYVKYPPIGSRAGAPGWGSTYYLSPGDPDHWLKTSNQATVIVGHIETVKGYDNAEEIISTPGLDMLYVGPYDLSIALGQPGRYDHPVVARAVRQIMQLCLKYRVPFGTSVSGPTIARELIMEGCRFFETRDELSMINECAARIVDEYRELASSCAIRQSHLASAQR